MEVELQAALESVTLSRSTGQGPTDCLLEHELMTSLGSFDASLGFVV